MDSFDPHHDYIMQIRESRQGRNAIHIWYKAFARQCNVVFALMIREMKVRYGRSSLGYAMAFVQPMLQKGLLIGLMMAASSEPPIGTSMVLFYWIGLSSYHMFGFVSNKVLSSLGESKKVRVLPTIMPMDYALMRAILEACTNIIITCIGLLLIYLYETEDAMPGAPLWVVQSTALMLIFGFGIGLINSVIGAFFPTYLLMWRAVSTVLMLTSGLFKVPDSLPYQVKQYMLWNPMTHGIELFRMGFYPAYYTDFVDVGYLMKWAFASLFIGLVAERVLRKRIMNRR